jgi:hypothetical protein
MSPGCSTPKLPGYTVPGSSKLPPKIAREQVGTTAVVTVVVTVNTEVTVLAEGHAEDAAVHEALEVTVTIDGAAVIVVSSVTVISLVVVISSVMLGPAAVTVTVDAKPVIVVVALQLGAMVGELVGDVVTKTATLKPLYA